MKPLAVDRTRTSIWVPLFWTAVAYHLGAFPAGVSAPPLWAIELGAVGFLVAAGGAWLTEDYYRYRRTRAPQTVSAAMNPPQLVLKGAWGAYLVAFLFALIVALVLAERGWQLLLFAAAGFFSGYYATADPIHWERRRWGLFVSSLSSTWIPFAAAAYIAHRFPGVAPLTAVSAAYFILIFYRGKKRFNLPRYTREPFPAYRHLPGKTPHPVRDPEGHSHNRKETKADLYLYGVDLFNHGYYWEAHEAWEVLWKAAQPESAASLYYQGLIQVSASILKVYLNNTEGASQLKNAGLEKLRAAAAAGGNRFKGLDLPAFIGDVERAFEAEDFKPPTIVLGTV